MTWLPRNNETNAGSVAQKNESRALSMQTPGRRCPKTMIFCRKSAGIWRGRWNRSNLKVHR